MSGHTQIAHYLSVEVTPTTSLVSLCFSIMLCYVLYLPQVFMHHIINCHLVAQKQDWSVLPEAEKSEGIASTPPLQQHSLLLDSPHIFCVRGCVFCVRREVSQHILR